MSSVLFVKFFSSLFAIVNPLGGVAIFISLTAGYPKWERRRTAMVTSFAFFCILTVAALIGEKILSFFGISIPAFQTAGGLILLLMAIAMLQAKRSPIRGTEKERTEAEESDSIAVFPMAMPYYAGPGSFALTILSAHDNYSMGGLATMIVCIALVAISILAALWFSTPLVEKLGATGINIITRIMGIILAAFSIEMIAAGLVGLFPILTS